MCEATYLTLSAPLLWQPVQKKETVSGSVSGFTHSHTPQHAGFAAMLFRMCRRMRVGSGRSRLNGKTFLFIRASVDALCMDGTSEISRDPRTKRLQTRRESLAMPSKHTNNNF